jgi:pimeloyl-ACP methyl ester carboxylesterase
MESILSSDKARGWLAGGAVAAVVGVAAAVYNGRKTKAAERRTPPVGRFTEVDGVRVHYLRSGKGPPIVLIHGNGVMLQDWIVPGIFDELARDHDVIAVDRPGFGYSARPRTTVWTPQKQAELLAKLLRQLGVEKACVVGHSFGTMVALALALDHSELVERLVLLDGYYFPSPRVDLLAQTGPAIPIVGDLIRFTLAPPAARAAMPLAQKAMFSPAAVSPAWREHFPVDMVVRPLQIRATAADYAVAIPSAWSLSRRYGELNLPMTVIHGVGDKIASFAGQGKRLHETIPGSRLVPVEGVGHMVHYSAMATVLREIASNWSGPGQSGVVLPVLEQESQGTGEAVGVVASEVPARDLVARPV